MGKFDDVQIDVVSTTNQNTTQVHAPKGQTPQHGADTPYVAAVAAGFSAGKQITAIFGTTAGVRYANPA